MGGRRGYCTCYSLIGEEVRERQDLLGEDWVFGSHLEDCLAFLKHHIGSSL